MASNLGWFQGDFLAWQWCNSTLHLCLMSSNTRWVERISIGQVVVVRQIKLLRTAKLSSGIGDKVHRSTHHKKGGWKKGHKKVKKKAAVTIRVIIDGIMEYFVQLCIKGLIYSPPYHWYTNVGLPLVLIGLKYNLH